MLLYFNVLFSPVWLALHLSVNSWKYGTCPGEVTRDGQECAKSGVDDLYYRNFIPLTLTSILNGLMIGVWILLEPVRLLCGYVGNIKERVAALAAFFLLTIFPQTLVQLYFFWVQQVRLPLEDITSVIMLVLNALEIYWGYTTTRKLIRKATAEFHLQNLQSAATTEGEHLL